MLSRGGHPILQKVNMRERPRYSFQDLFIFYLSLTMQMTALRRNLFQTRFS